MKGSSSKLSFGLGNAVRGGIDLSVLVSLAFKDERKTLKTSFAKQKNVVLFSLII